MSALERGERSASHTRSI